MLGIQKRVAQKPVAQKTFSSFAIITHSAIPVVSIAGGWPRYFKNFPRPDEHPCWSGPTSQSPFEQGLASTSGSVLFEGRGPVFGALQRWPKVLDSSIAIKAQIDQDGRNVECGELPSEAKPVRKLIVRFVRDCDVLIQAPQSKAGLVDRGSDLCKIRATIT